MRSKIPYLVISVIALVADQWSKAWATKQIEPVGSIEIIPGFFRFSYATNRGVAFSLFANSQFNVRWIFVAISIGAALFVLGYLIKTPVSKRRMNLALALLLAGIVGNLMDRVRLGEVVDFIELHWRDLYIWPTFNVADSVICIGAVLLAIDLLREESAARQQMAVAENLSTSAEP